MELTKETLQCPRRAELSHERVIVYIFVSPCESPDKMSRIPVIWVICAVAALLHANTIPAGFTFDDNFAVVSAWPIVTGGDGGGTQQGRRAVRRGPLQCGGNHH